MCCSLKQYLCESPLFILTSVPSVNIVVYFVLYSKTSGLWFPHFNKEKTVLDKSVVFSLENKEVLSLTFIGIGFYTTQSLFLKLSLSASICIQFNKEKIFQIHLFIEALLWGKTGVKWGKQTEAEGMKAIIGLWRSKAINCGEIRRLEWFAGKPSERMWYGNAWREKVPAGCWEEILSVICTTTHGCLLILALLCHQKQVICSEKRCISTSLKLHRD